MANPYEPIDSGAPYANSEARNGGRRQMFTSIGSIVAIAALSIISFSLITQALRLDSESASLPSRIQAEYASTSRSSWIGGIAAIVGTVLNAGSLIFFRKHKIVPIALLAITVIGLIAIAVIFKPS